MNESSRMLKHGKAPVQHKKSRNIHFKEKLEKLKTLYAILFPNEIKCSIPLKSYIVVYTATVVEHCKVSNRRKDGNRIVLFFLEHKLVAQFIVLEINTEVCVVNTKWLKSRRKIEFRFSSSGVWMWIWTWSWSCSLRWPSALKWASQILQHQILIP